MPGNAKRYISLVSAFGIAAMAYAFVDLPWPHDLLRFCSYVLLSLVAATLKVRLPGLTGTMSIGFVFVLLGVAELTPGETMLMACAGALLQCLWRAKSKPAGIQVLFSVSAVAISVMLTYECCTFARARFHAQPVAMVLAVATCVYFVANSLLVSSVLALVRRERLRVIWRQCYRLAFPYYLVGGVVAGLVAASSREFGWKPALLILPVMGFVFWFYRTYIERREMLSAAALPR
jgi:hypothetical protein